MKYMDYLFGVEESTGEVQGGALKKGVVGERNVNSPLTAKWKTPTQATSSQMPLCSNLSIHSQNKWRGYLRKAEISYTYMDSAS